MTEIYIISQADIKKYHPIADITQERIDPYILKAQDLDLKPVLNESLFSDFITKFQTTSDQMYAAYQTLLNGGTYTYSSQTIQFPGIKPMLCAYAMARFMARNQTNITRYGIVQKTNPQSEPLSQSSVTYQVNDLRDEAIAYQNQLERFLQQNVNTYPLYNTYPSETQNRNGVNLINSVGRTGSYRGWRNGNYYP